MNKRVLARIVPMIIIAGFSILFLGGCSLNIATKPDAYPFPSEQVFDIRSNIAVNIENFYTNPKVVEIGDRVFCDLQQFTGTALTMVQRELQIKGVKISPNTGKTVVLKMIYPRWIYGSFRAMTVHITLQAILENGQVITIDAEYQTLGNAYRAFNGATLKAVTGLLRDKEFSAYLNE